MKEVNNIGKISFLRFTSRINHHLLAVMVVGIVALICSPLSNTQSYLIVSFILLFVVSMLATFMGIGPVLLAATFSSLVWNFFFIPPHYTFHIDKTEDVLMFCMFFIIALLNGILTTKVRKQEKLARDREERTNALFQLTKELSKASGISEVLRVACEDVRKHFSSECLFILQDGSNMLLKEPHSLGDRFSYDEFTIADWVFRNSQKAGKFTDTMPDNTYTFYPLKGIRINPGVIAVKREKPFEKDKKDFWNTFLTQISNALEREFLAEEARKARFLDESDKLYKTLFNSISHELRIPVSTILGAADTLLTSQHPGNIQSALFHEIFTASLRLNRLIENLLNMSRLETGRLSVRLDWYDVNDLVNKVASDLKDELKPFSLMVSVPENMSLVRIDFGLMEQVLYNLLYNSCEHAPVSSNILLNTDFNNGELIIEVMDSGPGFPEHSLKKVFRKFFRVDGTKSGGLGLGLSIVKGFVDAHKGSITVQNREKGGAKFTIRIPSESPEIQNFQAENI